MTIVLLFGTSALALLFLCFLGLERAGREITVVATILTVLLVDAALYAGFEVPSGLFHPSLGGVSFRPYEVIIVVALLARLVARGVPRRLATSTLCWTAFFGWILLQAVVGLYLGHPGQMVSFEAKLVVYLGAMALPLGVPAEDFVRGRTMDRLITFAAVLAVAMILLDTSGFRRAGGALGVPLEEFGRLGSDFATICLAIGTVALGWGVGRKDRRIGLLVAAVPLILTAFVPSQRAVLISFVVLAVLAPVAFLTRSARSRLSASPAELVVAGMVVVALLCVPWMMSAWKGRGPSLVFTSRVSTAFTSPAKIQSAQDRLLQYQEAWPLIEEKPVFGWGLGKTITHFQPGPNQFTVTNLTHNILTDLLLRTGLVGLALFVAAAGLTLLGGIRAWRHHVNDEVACLALACVIVIVGLLGKGTVESIFEKFRLAVLLGLFVGILRSLAVSPPPSPLAIEPDRRVLI